jgi:dUTP pyrophosphatase
MKINVKVLTKEFYEHHPLPSGSTAGAAGIDLRAATFNRTVLCPGDTVLIPTGLVFEVPEAIVMLLLPRSGLGHKHGIVLGNSTGVIDPDFRGEVMVSVWNRSDDTYYINPGDRICQALFLPFYRVELSPVEELTSTDRDAGGLGSTGRA